MAFINERFPPDISFDASEKVRHSTTVIRVNSGARSANQLWAFPLREFNVSHAMRVKTYMDTVNSFSLTVAQGRTNTFRYKAWGDYKVSTAEGVLTLVSTDNYQMWKRYIFGSSLKDRKITLPVSGTITITGGGTYTINYLTGIITRTAGAAPTGWAGEYDVKASMGSDISEYVIRNKAAGDYMMSADQIVLQEER